MNLIIAAITYFCQFDLSFYILNYLTICHNLSIISKNNKINTSISIVYLFLKYYMTLERF